MRNTNCNLTYLFLLLIFIFTQCTDASLKNQFHNPPAKSGTVTLWWLNGELTKTEIREQMLAMRDKSGFSGVAPLTMHKMKPATSPEYPALWEDIGAETASARARLFSIRDKLFANGYPKVIQDWCDTKNMIGSGHPNGAYRPNPIQCPGDAILFYKHLDYPLTDYIHYYHHGVDGFKIPASAAYNFNKPVVVLEIYGNFQQKVQKLPNDGEMLYRAGMEAYARGVNYLLPHGTWWDESNVTIPPEISWRNPQMADALLAYNKWAGRCETLLRAGRHVADIGVLYPINDLQARYNFSDYKHSKNGRIVPEGSDYYDLITLLTRQIR